MLRHLFLTSLFVGTFGAAALAGVVNVPGISDPWLAGMPDGTLDNVGTPEPADPAPTYSPVFASSVSGGAIVHWSATGQVGHPGDVTDPDGSPWFIITSHLVGANHGISDVTMPIDSLLGVFLGPSQPDLNPAPGALDFSTQASRDYLTLSPALQQVFFMGDGLAGGSAQSIVAPAGATRLFLGAMDSYGWANNIGAFEVTLQTSNNAPDSCQFGWLALVLVLGLGALARRRATATI